ncbi:MAG: carboxypeptidase regulatory-like domain-containing protein [Bacteroidia bacterium]
MKKGFLLLLIFLSLNSLAQNPPVLEGTYLPVRNTTVRMVWDTMPGVMNVPTTGTNQVWDYTQANGQFVNIVDTFPVTTVDPSNTPYGQYFPNATHAGFMRTPFQARFVVDSNYTYWDINKTGMYIVGGFSIKHMIDSTLIYTNKEFYTPEYFAYQNVVSDTANYIGHFANIYGYKAKVRGGKIKTTEYIGYGTLKLPHGTYNDVALIKETRNQIDTVYVDLFNTNVYTQFTVTSGSSKGYNFLRNNTFGTNFLMYLHVPPANNSVEWGWYALPGDIGSISGNVYVDASESAPVTSGEMYLYREYSNYTKNDILAKAPIQANGSFQFDSIPYGEYRIAARPTTSLYPNSKITYYGDTTNWIDANTIITTSSLSAGHKLHLQYHPAPAGTSTISGTIGEDWAFNKNSAPYASIPVPGVGVVIKKHPGNTAARVIPTDPNGNFEITNLDNGDYTLFVDIPGMHMTKTYTVTVSNASSIINLDYTVGKDSIHPINAAAIGIKETKSSGGRITLKAYPNPFSDIASISVNVTESALFKLEAYNSLGQMVQILENKKLYSGKHNYTFDPKSMGLSSGIYLLKATTGGETTYLKLISK